jgi:hypothetical protein
MSHRLIVDIEVARPAIISDQDDAFASRGNMIVAGFPNEACALEMGEVVARALQRWYGKKRCGISLHVEPVRESDMQRTPSSFRS